MSVKNLMGPIIISFGIVLGMLALYQVGFQDGLKQGAAKNNQEITRLSKALNMLLPPMPDEIFTIVGTIRSMSGNILNIETPSLQKRTLPGEQPKMIMRAVSVPDTLRITKLNPFAPPQPPIRISGKMTEEQSKPEIVKFSDLKAGDRVVISSKTNIKDSTSFEATNVMLQAGF